MKYLIAWAVAPFIAVAIGASINLDSPEPEVQTTATQDAQRQAQRELRRDLAAAKICREAHGNASFTWTAAGELVCIPRSTYQLAAK